MPPELLPVPSDSDVGAKATTKKRKKKGANDALYLSAARRIARCHDLWCEPEKVFKIVRLLQDEDSSKYGDLDEDDMAREAREEFLSNVSEESRELSTRCYFKLVQMIPSLKTMINDPDKTSELADIGAMIYTEIKNTRSTDASRLKPLVPTFASPNPHDLSIIQPPIMVTKKKSELGLNHPLIARWLCPIDRLAEFDDDPTEGRRKLESGVIPMGGQDFPAFLCSGAMPLLPGERCVSSDILAEIFRSYFLIRIARHIFLGPSFAIDSPEKKNRSCNAILNDITTIEPEHIAYVCVHARFMIAAREVWSEVDGNFSYSEMYRAIILFIKDAEDVEWKKNLMEFWNEQVFGNKAGRGTTKTTVASTDTAPRLTTMEQLKASMKARRVAPPPLDEEDPPLPLDPALDSATVSQPETATRAGRGPSSRAPPNHQDPSFPLDPASRSGGPTTDSQPPTGTRMEPGHTRIPPALRRTLSNGSDRSMTPSLSRRPSVILTAESLTIPATPPRPAAPPASVFDTPTPLTPITNQKVYQPAKSAKAKGKRPASALPNEDTAAGGRAASGRASKRRK